MTPQQIGRYQIKAELGRGGMATVFHAYDPNFERDVALKVLPREFLHDPNFRARFNREARTIANLEHSAIVPVYDFGEGDGQPFLVMRLMSGGTLDERLAQGPFSITEAARIFQRLAPALDEAHRRNIIHRDLKPGNILFDNYGDAFLSDFGIVKLTEATHTLTGGGIVGTPAYMSPEQARGNIKLDNRSDIYAMGVILYQMLTGTRPYDADTPMGLAMMHVLEPVPRILEINPKLPPAIDEVISRAMAKDREERYSTTRELAAAIAAIAAQAEPPEITRHAMPAVRETKPPEPAPTQEAAAPTRKIQPDEQLPVTRVDTPKPGIPAAPEDAPTPAAPTVQAAQPTIQTQEARRGIPLWGWITGGVAVVLLVAVLVGAGSGLFGGNGAASPAETDTPQPASETDTPRPASETSVPVPTDLPEATATNTPVPTATEVPIGLRFSVCLVTDVGSINDGTFNQSTYEGMVRAAEDFGMEHTFIETHSQDEYASNLQVCIDEGYNIIITVGFLIAEATLEAAQANPDIYFIGIDQFHTGHPNNLVGVQFREDQAGFLAGALAAQMTENNIVAGIYGIDIPPVIKFRNGFEQGVRHIDPGIQILGVYIDDFVAPDRGAAAAEQFIGQGADVIFGAGGPTGSGGILRAAEAGVMVIGVDQDEYLTTFNYGVTAGAENLISSAIKRVDNGVYLNIRALVSNSGEQWQGGGLFVGDASNGGIGFAPAHEAAVPPQVTATLEGILAGLASGALQTGVDTESGELLDSAN